MKIRDYSREMASYALEKAKEAKEKGPFDKVNTQASKMPSMIRVNGLAPTFAFMDSKKEYDFTFDFICEWFAKHSIFKEHFPSKKEVMDCILKMDTPLYRTITNETIAVFDWFRRFVSALKE